MTVTYLPSQDMQQERLRALGAVGALCGPPSRGHRAPGAARMQQPLQVTVKLHEMALMSPVRETRALLILHKVLHE